VHTRVGAACTDDRAGRTRQLGESSLQVALNGPLLGLVLPSVER
jgi:hypothetical protein